MQPQILQDKLENQLIQGFRTRIFPFYQKIKKKWSELCSRYNFQLTVFVVEVVAVVVVVVVVVAVVVVEVVVVVVVVVIVVVVVVVAAVVAGPKILHLQTKLWPRIFSGHPKLETN